MDLSSLPVRVICNDGDIPMTTPGTGISKAARIEKKSNLVDEDFAFDYILEQT